MADHLEELPDSARLWIFALQHRLDAEKHQALAARLRNVVASWKAHGAAVSGGFSIRYDRFILVAADEEVTKVSGCSIDSLVRGVRIAVSDAQLTLGDDSDVFYRDSAGEICVANRDSFRSLVSNDEVTLQNIVFNNTVLTVGDLRQGRWECAAKESWHARAFKFPALQTRSAAQ